MMDRGVREKRTAVGREVEGWVTGDDDQVSVEQRDTKERKRKPP